MRSDYVLFEAPCLRRAICRRMSRLNAAFWGVVALTTGAGTLSAPWFASSPIIVGAGLGALVCAAGGISVNHYLLSRTVWCVRVTPNQLISYDCARRTRIWGWDAIRQVDLTAETLRIVQSRYWSVSLTTQFDDFPTLGHLIWRHAEQRGAPFTIEGQPLDELDVHSLYPTIVCHPPAVPPGPDL